jgi:ATP-dependent DNA helicase DinG
LTSATLSVGTSFEFFTKRLGLADASGLIVESPFDHARQAVLYLPKGMPEPREPAFFARAMDEIEALLDVTEGRAFLLFTSHAALARAREHLGRLDRFPLFVQGEGSKAALLQEFKTTPRAVLLGTNSFWHGVDVPGEALSLVVIDKLPFDVPSDPLIAARIERIRENEGNPFAEYQTPMAVLDLKQGLGRLLRSRGDRGILAVLDSRLTTKGYGKTFLASLPPYPIVRARDDAERFFRGPEHA